MMQTPSFSETTKVWAKIGLLSFGGPAAQIAMMHKEVVEQKSWLTERQYLSALSFCMLLPGPEAMQLATYAGWRINGFWGGLIAGLLFVIPGALVVLLLSTIYAFAGDVPLVQALFLGVKATVVIIVIEALIKVSKRALSTSLHYIIAVFAFIGIFFLNIPYPLIVIASAIIGWFWLRSDTDPISVPITQPFQKTVQTIALWLVIWWAPVLLIDLLTPLDLLTEIATFFSKLAVVTFGGAYAVLAYMTQDAVTLKGWLSTGEMMDGLGLAETTPGPLILVTEFVGFMAGFKQGGWALGAAAACVTLWVTFAPCFLWIFAGAPYIEWIETQPRLRGALSAITAAVVGVISNLSLWFALHVFFEQITTTQLGPISLLTPTLSSLNPLVVILAIASGYFLLIRHWNILWVLALSAMTSTIAGLIL